MKHLILTDAEIEYLRQVLVLRREDDDRSEREVASHLLGKLKNADVCTLEQREVEGGFSYAFVPKKEHVADEQPKETTTPIIGADAHLFSYNDVKAALCEACKLGVSEVWNLDHKTVPAHHLNGTRIPCTAHAWRSNRTVHAKTFPNELPGHSPDCDAVDASPDGIKKPCNCKRPQ